MERMTYVQDRDLSQINVVDKDGNSVEDIRNLKYSEEYNVFWYSGTQYTEVLLTANCSCYNIMENSEGIDIAGRLTKNGYAIYDLSGVPAGFYRTPDGGVIKIE